jgi:hypothetical protein
MLKVMVDTFNNDLVYTIIYSYIVLYIYNNNTNNNNIIIIV